VRTSLRGPSPGSSDSASSNTIAESSKKRSALAWRGSEYVQPASAGRPPTEGWSRRLWKRLRRVLLPRGSERPDRARRRWVDRDRHAVRGAGPQPATVARTGRGAGRTGTGRDTAEADRRIADERLRIARDVHDVLAHTVSVMTVQAGVAADVFERDPRSARSALSKVRAAGREALTEVRATVAVLRGARPAERRRRQSWTRRLQTKWRIRALASSCSSDPGGHHGRRVITNDGTRAK
jgi:signal transduction histidine kinase